jgi:transposase
LAAQSRPLHAVGVEGTGSYGSALARHLAVEGVDVVDVARANRQVRRRHGKNVVVDAIAAARAVLSGEATGAPKADDGAVEALRALEVVQRSANKARTQSVNQLRNLVVTAPDELRGKLRDLPARQLLRTCAAFRVAADDDTLLAITRLALRELAQRVLMLDEQLAQIRQRLQRITAATAPELVALHGAGPDTASTLLVTAGDTPDRLKHEKSFASLTGSSPLAASSGKRHRHRLNRGGDRQANAALWRIAMVRLATDQRTRDYLARRVAEGETKPKPSAASSDTSPAKSSTRYRDKPSFDSRSITYLRRVSRQASHRHEPSAAPPSPPTYRVRSPGGVPSQLPPRQVRASARSHQTPATPASTSAPVSAARTTCVDARMSCPTT